MPDNFCLTSLILREVTAFKFFRSWIPLKFTTVDKLIKFSVPQQFRLIVDEFAIRIAFAWINDCIISADRDFAAYFGRRAANRSRRARKVGWWWIFGTWLCEEGCWKILGERFGLSRQFRLLCNDLFWWLVMVRYIYRHILIFSWLLPLFFVFDGRLTGDLISSERSNFSKRSREFTIHMDALLVIRSSNPLAYRIILVEVNYTVLWFVSMSVYFTVRFVGSVANDARLGDSIYPDLVWFALPFIWMILSWCDVLCRWL